VRTKSVSRGRKEGGRFNSSRNRGVKTGSIGLMLLPETPIPKEGQEGMNLRKLKQHLQELQQKKSSCIMVL
jgi:hypothetical protein